MDACQKKRGLTLVELLVVITILLILVTVVLPLTQPNSNERLVREAARQVNTFFANVQTRALAENRPYGVILLRAAGDDGPCYDLAMARSPRPYAGDEVEAVAIVRATNSDGDWQRTLTYTERAASSIGNNLNESAFVDQGDLIRFNYRGPWYVITAVNQDSSVDTNTIVQFTTSSAIAPPKTGATDGLPFQIRRMPRTTNVRRSAASTMTLPVGAYIDMAASGAGSTGTMSDPGQVIVIVDGQGRLSSLEAVDVGAGGNTSTNISDALYLLIGSSKQVSGNSSVQTWLNSVRNLYPDSASVWVTVSQATNRLTTVQNLGTDFVVTGSTARVTQPDNSYVDYDLTQFESAEWKNAKSNVVQLARASAKSGPAMGGR